jgi:hypothetical protein
MRHYFSVLCVALPLNKQGPSPRKTHPPPISNMHSTTLHNHQLLILSIMKKNLFCFLTAWFFIALLLKHPASAQTNTATGFQALSSITTGTYNTATGFQALRFNTSGSFNTAHGARALYFNTTGINNVAFGVDALINNTTGSFNTATGNYALVSNSIGQLNSAHGTFALYENTTGNNNTATGFQALRFNTSGSFNTAHGARALYFNTTGINNVAFGVDALLNNTTGSFNTATGNYALVSNTSGNSNTAHGARALYFNTTGDNNAAFGVDALINNTTGFSNTAIGYQILQDNTTGYGSTAAGYQALRANTTGIGNIGIGYGAGASSNDNFICTFIGALTDATANLTNSTALGFNAVVTASNQVRIGNTDVSSIGGQVNWTVFSDGRYKNNLNEDVPGLDFITKLRPVTYNLDVNAIEGNLQANRSRPGGEGAITLQQNAARDQKGKDEKAKIKYTGFVAQEVEEVAKNLNYDFSGVDKPKSKEDFYGLRYGDFVVPLVKAVQEQQQQIEEQQQQIDQLKAQNGELKELITKLLNEKGIQLNGSNNTTATLSGAYLKQNVPNPHNGATTIQYYLPQGVGSAKIVITNAKGQVLKTIAVNARGDGQVRLHAGTLSAGSYAYSLWVDGQQVDTKKMLIVK